MKKATCKIMKGDFASSFPFIGIGSRAISAGSFKTFSPYVPKIYLCVFSPLGLIYESKSDSATYQLLTYCVSHSIIALTITFKQRYGVMLLKREELLAGFSQEIRRGTIFLCVLAKLRQSAYGYNLIAELSEAGISVEANTLYPLLRRLEAQGLLESTWNTTDGAKPRKYYVTTALGNEMIVELKKHWYETVQNMNNILED